MDHGLMVQKSLGQSRSVRYNSGSLQYTATATKKKRQVDDDGIEAQKALGGRFTPTQLGTGAPTVLILVRCFGSVRKILRQEISEAKRRGRSMVYLSVPKIKAPTQGLSVMAAGNCTANTSRRNHGQTRELQGTPT